MINKKILKPFLLLLLSVVIIFFIFCTKHKPTQYEPKAYFLYASNDAAEIYGGGIYVINTLTNTIVDTLTFDHPWQIGITPNGKTLYLMRTERDTTSNWYTIFYEIDTETKDIKYQGYDGSVIVSPDGNHLFHTHGGLKVLDANTHQVLHHDTSSLYSLAFDQRERIVYGGLPTWGWVGVFDYYRMQWIRRFQIISSTKRSLSFMDMEISPDGKTLYFVAMPANYPGGIFGAYDLEFDSLLTESLINSYHGKICMTINGSYVYVTDPGGYDIPELPPLGEISVFDTRINTFLSPISTDSINEHLHTDQIVVTPDGRRAYVSNYGSLIMVIDANTHTVIDTIQFAKRNTSIRFLAIQSKL